MGFSTIIDILGATIIGGLLLLTIIRLNGNSTENRFVYGNDKILQREIVNLADIIEIDFRKIGYCEDPSKVSDTTTLILFADTSSITFLTDIDRNGFLDSLWFYVSDTTALSFTKNPRDRIMYRKLNTQQPLIICTNITRFYIKYFDALGMELMSPVAQTGRIAFMQISFKVEDPEAYDEKYSEAYWQQVRLTSRNLIKR